jgi:hypothetical protein
VPAVTPIARVRIGLGVLVVLVELGVVVLSHLPSSCCSARYFAWAPNDYSVPYVITARVNGRLLNSREVNARYDDRQRGYWEDPPARLIHELRAVEATYGSRDHTVLTLRYRLNGHPWTVWTYTHG